MRRLWPVAGASAAAAAVLASQRSRLATRRRAQEIAALDPVADHERITHLLGAYEFGWDFETALSLALLRTFASPSISGLLARTGEFAARPVKRYEDTELLLAEVAEHGYASGRGRAAIRRINQMHRAYDIADADMLYVLSTFVIEPIRWADRYGWRPLTDDERQALFVYWRNLGPLLGVRDIPDTLEGLWDFYRRYERAHLRFAASNQAVADHALRPLLERAPPRLRPLARQVVMALLDPHVRAAFGAPPPPAVLRSTLVAALRARAWLLGHLVPERRTPYLITQRPMRTYPDGYEIPRLGTFPTAEVSSV